MPGLRRGWHRGRKCHSRAIPGRFACFGRSFSAGRGHPPASHGQRSDSPRHDSAFGCTGDPQVLQRNYGGFGSGDRSSLSGGGSTSADCCIDSRSGPSAVCKANGHQGSSRSPGCGGHSSHRADTWSTFAIKCFRA